MLLFRDLEKNSYENKDTSELLDITLIRLEFVKISICFRIEMNFITTHWKVRIEKYSGVNETAEAYFLLAQSFKMSGEENPEQNKWKIKKLSSCAIRPKTIIRVLWVLPNAKR